MPLNMLVKVGQEQKIFDHTSRCLSGKSMNHSRQYSSYGSHFAVDGIYDPLEIRESVWYSMFVLYGQSGEPWMVIDLESTFCIEAVKLWPRGRFMACFCPQRPERLTSCKSSIR